MPTNCSDEEVVERETFGSAVEMGVEALKLLSRPTAHRAARTFKEHDEQALQEIAGDGR